MESDDKVLLIRQIWKIRYETMHFLGIPLNIILKNLMPHSEEKRLPIKKINFAIFAKTRFLFA